jgi:hypothetical protein
MYEEKYSVLLLVTDGCLVDYFAWLGEFMFSFGGLVLYMAFNDTILYHSCKLGICIYISQAFRR